jgi:hypothetical protein
MGFTFATKARSSSLLRGPSWLIIHAHLSSVNPSPSGRRSLRCSI